MHEVGQNNCSLYLRCSRICTFLMRRDRDLEFCVGMFGGTWRVVQALAWMANVLIRGRDWLIMKTVMRKLFSEYSCLWGWKRPAGTSWVGSVLLALTVGCGTTDVHIAEQLSAQGDWDAAVEAYRAAVKRLPFDMELQGKLDAAKSAAAQGHYAVCQRSADSQQWEEALTEFRAALSLDPGPREYHLALADVVRVKEARELLQTADKLKGIGRLDEAAAAYERAVQLDPSLTAALDGVSRVTAQQRQAKGFGGSMQPLTLRFQNAKLREVFEVLTKTAGLNVVFDKEVRDDPITIFIKEMAPDDALNLLLNTNGLTAQRVGGDTLLIIPNTKQKLAQYQDLMIRTFYLSNAKAKDAVNLIRTLFESKHIYVDEKVNAIVVRDEPAKLILAERVLQSIDHRDAEVQLDVEVLEVDRTKSLKYGVNFAKAAGAGIVPPGFTGGLSTAPTPFTYQQLAALGTGSYLFTLPGTLLLDFFKNDTNAKTLAAPKLRVLNNKQASIQVGDKQPILLSTTNVLPGQAATGAIPTTSTVTSIEFKDVGVKLTVEPSMNLTDELTLKVKIEVTRLGDQVTLQASPEIKQFKFGTRTAETVLMLRDHESIVLGGLIQDDARKTRVTVPVLGDIPWIGNLFSTWTEDMVTTEVVLTITPHLVRSLLPPSVEAQAYWSGTESVFATAPLFSPQVMPVSMRPAPAVDHGKVLPRAADPVAANLPPSRDPAVPSRPLSPPSATNPVLSSQLGTPRLAGDSGGDGPMAGLVAIRPESVNASVGSEVQLDMTMVGIATGVESQMTVTYDPKILEFVRVLEGDASAQSYSGASLLVVPLATPGVLMLTVRQPEAGQLASQRVLAKLVFASKATGSSSVMVQSAQVRGTGGETLPVSFHSSLVMIR